MKIKRLIFIYTGSLLVWVSLAMKKHYDHGKSYQGKYLMGWLTDQRFSSLSLCGTWQCAGRRGAAGNRKKTVSLGVA